MNAETFREYEEVLSKNGWTRVPGDPNSLIIQWLHPTLRGGIHLSVGETGKGWRHYIEAPFPHCTGADVESLRHFLAGEATKRLREEKGSGTSPLETAAQVSRSARRHE
jgi:hypothetical protein